MATYPLRLAGWEHRAIIGADEQLGDWFAQLWPNGSTSDPSAEWLNAPSNDTEAVLPATDTWVVDPVHQYAYLASVDPVEAFTDQPSTLPAPDGASPPNCWGQADWATGTRLDYVGPPKCRTRAAVELVTAHELGHLRWPGGLGGDGGVPSAHRRPPQQVLRTRADAPRRALPGWEHVFGNSLPARPESSPHPHPVLPTARAPSGKLSRTARKHDEPAIELPPV